jgi:hypothetical protein
MMTNLHNHCADLAAYPFWPAPTIGDVFVIVLRHCSDWKNRHIRRVDLMTLDGCMVTICNIDPVTIA